MQGAGAHEVDSGTVFALMISQLCSKGNVWTDKLEYNVATIVAEKWAQLSGNTKTEWSFCLRELAQPCLNQTLGEFTEL